MSAKGPKRQKGQKAKAADPGVLGSLPSTRSARIGGPRTPAPAPARQLKARAPVARPVQPPPPAPDPGPPVAPERDSTPAQSGTELVTSVVHAAGELAQVGLTVGGQVVRRAVGRLPRP